MGEYGYAYKRVSAFSTTSTGVRNETRSKPAAAATAIQQPFVPSSLPIPKTSDDHGYSEGHVTKKTIIPVTSSSTMPTYHDSSTPTSPVSNAASPRKLVHDFPTPTKMHNETNRPQRFAPVPNSTAGWHQTPQPTSPAAYSSTTAEGRKPFGSANHDGYYDHQEGRKPIQSTIRNDNYDARNGYATSDYGGKKPGPMANSPADWRQTPPQPTSPPAYNSSVEGRKPIGSDTFSTQNGYDHGYGGHGDYGGGRKEGRNPIESTTMNDNYDAHNYGYGKKGPHKAIPSTIRNDNNNGYGDYNNSNKEGHNHGYGGYYNNGYGGPNGYGGYGGNDDDDQYNRSRKEVYKPIGNPNYNNNGYGINYNNRDGHGHGHLQKPNIGPKISIAWAAAPRKGTQLSEPTNDIEKALELLRIEAAKRDQHMHMHMPSNINTDHDYEYQYDRPTATTTNLPNWAAPPGPAGSNGSPQHGSPRVANNKFGNSQPRMSPTRETIFDGRDGGGDYHRDEYGRHVPLIDSREAERKFKGARVW